MDPLVAQHRDDGGIHSSPRSVPQQRKKLVLKPRSSETSAPHVTSTASPDPDKNSATGSSKPKNNPFGAALPREQILQRRGVDAATMDQQLERKIAAVIRPTYTMAQEAQLDAVQRHLEELTAALRNANEQELPEEEYRHAEQAKRIELNQLLEQFALANKDNDESTATPFKKESSSNPTIKNSGNSDHYGKYTKNHPVRGNNSGFDKYQHNHHHSNPSSDSWASTRKEEKIEESDAYTSFFSNRRRQPRDGE